MTRYNLEDSQTDRINFDDVQRQYAEAMINSLGLELALQQDPNQYAEIGWEAFEIDMEQGSVEVDDVAEAKARFMKVFAQTVREWQAENRSTLNYLNEELRQLADETTYDDWPETEQERNRW